jgi:integrase
MQNGSLMKSTRRNGEKVWEFRWRDRTSGKAVSRRIVLGTTQQVATETEARVAVAGIVLEINVDDPRLQTHALTISQLTEHYRRRELSLDNTWKTYSTKKGYDNYLKRWIVPKWGEHFLGKVKPIEVELWLRQLPLARSSCAKIKNIMSVLLIMLADTNSLTTTPSISFAKVPNGARYRISFLLMKSSSF